VKYWQNIDDDENVAIKTVFVDSLGKDNDETLTMRTQWNEVDLKNMTCTNRRTGAMRKMRYVAERVVMDAGGSCLEDATRYYTEWQYMDTHGWKMHRPDHTKILNDAVGAQQDKVTISLPWIDTKDTEEVSSIEYEVDFRTMTQYIKNHKGAPVRCAWFS